MPGGRRAGGTLVWDDARSGFLPETCGLFSLSLNGAAGKRWMNEGSMEQGIGRPQSKPLAQRRDHLKLRWDTITLSSPGGNSCMDGVEEEKSTFKTGYEVCTGNSIVFASFLLTSVHMGAI